MIRALVVDDHPKMRLMVSRMLERSGDIEVVGEAEDGEQAVEFVKQLDPDVVLLDILMPRQDGFAVLRALKRQPASPKVVVLSSYDSPSVKKAVFEAGANDFVSKVVAHKKLLAAVRAVVSA